MPLRYPVTDQVLECRDRYPQKGIPPKLFGSFLSSTRYDKLRGLAIRTQEGDVQYQAVRSSRAGHVLIFRVLSLYVFNMDICSKSHLLRSGQMVPTSGSVCSDWVSASNIRLPDDHVYPCACASHMAYTLLMRFLADVSFYNSWYIYFGDSNPSSSSIRSYTFIGSLGIFAFRLFQPPFRRI